MKKIVPIIIFVVFIAISSALGSEKDLEVQGRALASKNPPFHVTLPSDLKWVHSASVDHPSENSLTRTFFFIKDKKKEVEEMLVVQIADKTNPQAGPMVVPPLKPYEEKKMYVKGKVKKGEVQVEYLIQLMAWNPDASSLQPIVKKGLTIPSHWALQTQILFQPQLESAIFLRYSKDIHSFELKVSDEVKNWDKESISGNEKKVYESFHKAVSGMIESLRFQTL
jgi:hypothetical protein